ncbi:DUF6456 domain-containing protein [Sandarakinorhabdus cyanobacteriorum]|uniref:DUF6456 domain-containing protein n=1 Tax=Sandarakinorhabdus cyanobacteriorum TaxID=1981098 RepID=UPI001FAEC3EF|nr:DUF6456 domain-containing protein [Sandarakinorhabdus cyanobacteriorum]
MPNTAETADVPPATANRLIGTRTLPPGDRIDRAQVAVNLAEAPLAWLARRGHISAAQLAAGMRLRDDYHAASLGPCVTMRWDPLPSSRRPGSAPEPGGSQIAARRRFDAAVAACGPGLADVLWRVVCAGEGLEAAERGLGWPARAGKLLLSLALDRLVSHYGVKE